MFIDHGLKSVGTGKEVYSRLFCFAVQLVFILSYFCLVLLSFCLHAKCYMRREGYERVPLLCQGAMREISMKGNIKSCCGSKVNNHMTSYEIFLDL